MHGVRFTGTDMADADWLDAEVIEGAWSGVEALRGALVTSGQLLDLAPTLAAAVGLIVRE